MTEWLAPLKYTSSSLKTIVDYNTQIDEDDETMDRGCRGEVVIPEAEAPLFTPFRQKPCALTVTGFSCTLSTSERKLICVTSANSFLASLILKQLLARGYLVRATVQNQVEVEEVREQIKEEEMMRGLESVVVVKMGDLQSLCEAFRGCHAVFHTSSFIDPAGISGYSDRMAFLETEGAKNVIEACGRAAYVKRCIFTSSLLASIWQGDGAQGPVDESCWSNEEFCRENKLWLALGKTTAEKVAWRKSKELKVNLVAVCPGLLMDPTFPNAHMETSVPYLKGGSIMWQQGILATIDAQKVAEAHIHVYEAMDNGAGGRYLCFGRVIRRLDEVIDLEDKLKMHGSLSRGRNEESQEDDNDETRFTLTNSKLTELMSRAAQRSSCKQ